jgi:hypothetical protein
MSVGLKNGSEAKGCTFFQEVAKLLLNYRTHSRREYIASPLL